MSKSKKIFLSIMIVFLLSFANLAAVVKNDSSAFMTKPEFDSLKNEIDAQINMYNQNVDSKIDQAIAEYLAGTGGLDNKQIRIIINFHYDLPVVNEKDYDEDKHYFAIDTGEEYAARKLQDGTYEWKVVDPIGNINIDKTGADEYKVPVVNSVGKYEIERAVLEKRIEKDNDLLTISELTVYDETNNVDKNYEMMTENAMAKVMAKAFGVSYTDTGNVLKKTLANAFGLVYSETKTFAQMNYDNSYPIGTIVMQSSAPNVPEGVNATWEKVTTDKIRYLYIDNGVAKEKDTIDATAKTEDYVLTTLEIPAHKHPITDPGHTHNVSESPHSHNFTLNVFSSDTDMKSGSSLSVVVGRDAVTLSASVTGSVSSDSANITQTENSDGGGGHSHNLTNLKVDGVAVILWKRIE